MLNPDKNSVKPQKGESMRMQYLWHVNRQSSLMRIFAYFYRRAMVDGIVSMAIRDACLLLIFFFAAPALATSTVTTWDTGLVTKGKALFTGSERFAKGGAPCAACHAFRGLGITGGNLAADLTDLYDGMGEEGLNEVLKSLDFPVMKKIYADRPLTNEEIVALIAFTRAAAVGPKDRPSLLFPVSGIAVFLCCLAALLLCRRRIG